MKLAAIFNRHWEAFAGAKPYLLNSAHYSAAEALCACRTAALGAEVYQCACCQRQRLRYHSCHHRACTQCDKHKQHAWAQAQEAKLLDTEYYLLTFTLPAELRDTCYKQQQWFYGILFEAVSETLNALDLKRKLVMPDGGCNPATLGFTAVLHTWTREMQYHPHIHVVMPGLSLARDGQRIHRPGRTDYLMPHRAIAKRFKIVLRRKLAEHDAETQRADLAGIPQSGWDQRWVVDVEAVGNGRSALRYLARYVHRTAVSEERILGETADGRIRLNCQDSRTKQWGVRVLGKHEFLRRWCLHVLPKGFTRLRHYGFLSAAAVEKRGKIHHILQMPAPEPTLKPKAADRPEVAVASARCNCWVASRATGNGGPHRLHCSISDWPCSRQVVPPPGPRSPTQDRICHTHSHLSICDPRLDGNLPPGRADRARGVQNPRNSRHLRDHLHPEGHHGRMG